MNTVEMRIWNLVFIFFFIVSCKSGKRELQPLDKVIDRIWAENVRTFDNVISEVEDAGNRTLDVQVVEYGKLLLKLRKEYEIPEYSDSLESNFSSELVISYLNGLQNVLEKFEIDQEKKNEIIDLTNGLTFDEQLNNRKIMINLLLLESELFEKMARMVGSRCIFCQTFNLSIENDAVNVGVDN